MNKSTKFLPEVRERAVRMVHEHRGGYTSRLLELEVVIDGQGCMVAKPMGLENSGSFGEGS